MLLYRGGVIYLYRKRIERINRWVALIIAVASTFAYYLVGANTVTCLLVSGTLLICTMICQSGLLDNKITHFFSGISMEIYLSHMAVFRALEKLHLNTVLGNGWLQYVVTVVAVLAGASVFAVVVQKAIKRVIKT